MRAFVMWFVAVTLTVSPAMAGSGKDKDATAAKTDAKSAATTKSADATKQPDAAKQPTSAKPDAPAVEAELQQLKELLQAQTQELEAQRAVLKEQQQKMEALEERLRSAQPATAAAEASTEATATEQAEAKKDETGPSSIKYKGISITPGGFIAAETVFRNRATSGDINTPFTGIPYPSNALSKVTENNFTARQTRATLLAETNIGGAKVSGYYEADFLGAGTTSNNRQSNSYVFRQRQLWANVTWENGFSVAAGQMWSLVTESKKGIANRQEALPLQIDPQYVVGWAWQRAYSFRVVKDFGKFAFGAAIEGPQTTVGGRGFPTNFFVNAPGSGGGLYNAFDSTGYTVNRAPDFLVKGTLDPGWGHYEVVGILSDFRDRVYPCGVGAIGLPLPTGCANATSVTGATNDSRVGGGIGATARFPVVAKKVDLVAHFQGGDGIGRYSSAQLADVTARPDGTLAPIRSAAWLGMVELHPNPKFDIYAYGGGEYAARTAYSFINAMGHPVPVGYGSALFNDSGCATETAPGGPGAPGAGGTCTGDIHHIVEGTLGFWHKLYNGPKGRVQWGLQYSYLTKYGWSGNNFSSTTGVAGPSVRPHAVDNMVFTSFRYYLP
jgi:hypothetical protein